MKYLSIVIRVLNNFYRSLAVYPRAVDEVLINFKDVNVGPVFSGY